ncbi:hypothetical protein Agub_g1402 [Astrephomene gubernaculifera]|uniref:Uncharacterized protein n=1 Tax=Astrephomene gubernaculifera TaxID=47775 RepID=A0AAD3DHE1_9CHLO|nr:hypothetical protein Agub_g1402 [Astrephomene gubernaculifera]
MSFDRDAKRVVQVLVPGIPPPVMDYVFASMTKASAGRGGICAQKSAAPSPPRYTLRRCDSGPLGELSLFDLALTSGSRRGKSSVFEQRDALEFHYTPEPDTIPSGKSKKR